MKRKTKKIWYVIGGVVIIIVLAIWIILANVNNGVVCNPPYIQVGESCCLDENLNRVCDSDEQEEEILEKYSGKKCGDGGSSGGGGGGGGSSSSSKECIEDWNCSVWSNIKECGTRTCNDIQKCGTTNLKPITIKECLYEDEEPESIDLIEEEPKTNLTKYILIGLFIGIIILIVIWKIRKNKQHKKNKGGKIK